MWHVIKSWDISAKREILPLWMTPLLFPQVWRVLQKDVSQSPCSPHSLWPFPLCSEKKIVELGAGNFSHWSSLFTGGKVVFSIGRKCLVLGNSQHASSSAVTLPATHVIIYNIVHWVEGLKAHLKYYGCTQIAYWEWFLTHAYLQTHAWMLTTGMQACTWMCPGLPVYNMGCTGAPSDWRAPGVPWKKKHRKSPKFTKTEFLCRTRSLMAVPIASWMGIWHRILPFKFAYQIDEYLFCPLKELLGSFRNNIVLMEISVLHSLWYSHPFFVFSTSLYSSVSKIFQYS